MAGLYIHVPFCAKRCIYCDFYSQTNTKYKDDYIKAVIQELILRKDYIENEPINTIYLGGGTPSQLQANDFEILFNTLSKYYDISSCEEITLEANPDDISNTYLNELLRFPFNRISLGIQSFNDKTLHFLNRRHNREQAIKAVSLCQDAGLNNLSIDLMYGLPAQTNEAWTNSLSEALQLDVPHISAYHLTYEENTTLYLNMQKGIINPIDEEISIQLFHTLINKLTDAGYMHYEISNFCKPGYLARHNTAYWTNQKYIGVGPSAHSYNHHSRQWNVASLPDYIQKVMNAGSYYEKETLDIKTRYNDYILTHLRTMWGIRLNDLFDRFGKDFAEYFIRQAEPYIIKKWLKKDGETIQLTKDGILVSDSIFCDLIK